MGGSDQWGNILDGCDLIRRARGAVAHALTFPLLTRPDGSKFGKSEQGNVWLDPELTSPYAFYQFWLNVEDAQVVRLLSLFTFLPHERLDEVAREARASPERRAAQRLLAAEITALVHGREALARAEQTTAALFSGDRWEDLSAEQLADAFAGSPSSDLPREKLGTPEATLVAVVAGSGLCPSRGQARHAIAAGSVSVNGRTLNSVGHVLTERDLLAGGHIVLRRGKKTVHVVKVR
jgi:tyrosyl-tRNA synthetase